MVLIAIECPSYKSTDVKKNGTSTAKAQHYLCKACKKTFQRDFKYEAYDPSTRSKIYFQTINGSGTRAIARTLGIAPRTVTTTLKTFESSLWYVNYDYLLAKSDKETELEIDIVTEAEMDEMWKSGILDIIIKMDIVLFMISFNNIGFGGLLTTRLGYLLPSVLGHENTNI